MPVIGIGPQDLHIVTILQHTGLEDQTTQLYIGQTYKRVTNQGKALSLLRKYVAVPVCCVPHAQWIYMPYVQDCSTFCLQAWVLLRPAECKHLRPQVLSTLSHSIFPSEDPPILNTSPHKPLCPSLIGHYPIRRVPKERPRNKDVHSHDIDQHKPRTLHPQPKVIALTPRC